MLHQQLHQRVPTHPCPPPPPPSRRPTRFVSVRSEAVDTKKAVKKPAWLRQKAGQGERFEEVKESLSRLKLNTVCEEAKCPNIGECWNGGGDGVATATIMLLGDTCTRGCCFYAVKTIHHPPHPDPVDPLNTTITVASWGSVSTTAPPPLL